VHGFQFGIQFGKLGSLLRREVRVQATVLHICLRLHSLFFFKLPAEQALSQNTFGSNNTADGAFALGANTNGASNTAVGLNALLNNTTGSGNVAIGAEAGGNVITANNVICIGDDVGGADVTNTTWIRNVYGVTTQSGTTAPVVVSDGGQLGTAPSSERFKKGHRQYGKGQ
jgi:hypothetical protein